MDYEIVAEDDSIIQNQNSFATDFGDITGGPIQGIFRSANQLKDSELMEAEIYIGNFEPALKKEEEDAKNYNSDQLKENCIKLMEENLKREKSNSPSDLKYKSEFETGPEVLKRKFLGKKGSFIEDLYLQADGASNINYISRESEEQNFNDVDNSSLTLARVLIIEDK